MRPLARDHTIVLASNNAGKLREINAMLTDLGLHAQPQSAFGAGEANETGLTFVENAILKARYAAQHAGHPSIADDSGLEIDALDGRPGIYSARYAGKGATDADNLQKVLAELANVPATERTARFQCVMVYMRHAEDPTPLICQGTWEGQITYEPRGENGFGYDPIFFVPTHHCTSAELSSTTKNELSHRGQALRALLAALKSQSEH